MVEKNKEYNRIVLKVEVLEESPQVVEINQNDLLSEEEFKDMGSLGARVCDDFKDKAFWLNNAYRWVLGKDSHDELCLVPLRKSKR